MEEELRSATNKYARVNIIRKYRNAYSDYMMIGNKQYDIDTGTYTNTFYTKILCFTCNVKCEENIINGTWSWAYVQNNGNNCVKYQKCKSCISKKIAVCILCCMPKSMCTKAKVTTILILRQHLHRDIIPIILNKIHG
jgi:hypothetical protein